MGKDGTICEIFENLIDYCIDNKFETPRFVTLGNVRCPPFIFNGEDTDLDYMLKRKLINETDYSRYKEGIIPIPNDMYFFLEITPFWFFTQTCLYLL